MRNLPSGIYIGCIFSTLNRRLRNYPLVRKIFHIGTSVIDDPLSKVKIWNNRGFVGSVLLLFYISDTGQKPFS